MNCIKCNQEIPAGRLKALPNAKTCIACSGTKMVKSITTLNGTGEDTWNDIVFVAAETYDKLGLDANSNSVDE
jgi:hypothetical protein